MKMKLIEVMLIHLMRIRSEEFVEEIETDVSQKLVLEALLTPQNVEVAGITMTTRIAMT